MSNIRAYSKFIGNLITSKIAYRLPYKLNFAVTYKCNSRCLTCDVWKIYRESSIGIKNELSLSEIECVFKNMPRCLTWLSLTGGEPFLREDFQEIVFAAINHIKGLSLLGFPTNGLPEKKIINLIKELLKLKKRPAIMIAFSIEGPEEIHNRIRGVEGSYKHVMQVYHQVRDLCRGKIDVNIDTTINMFNVGSLERFLTDLGASNTNLLLAGTGHLYKHVIKPENFVIKDSSMVRELLRSYNQALSHLNLRHLMLRVYTNELVGYINHPDKMPLPCSALRSSIAMDPYGNITPCLMWGEVLGNMRDFNYDLKKILNSEKALVTMKKIKNGSCPVCWTLCEAAQTIIDNWPRALSSIIAKTLTRRGKG